MDMKTILNCLLITLVGCDSNPKEEKQNPEGDTALVEDTEPSDGDSETGTTDTSADTADTEETDLEPEPEAYAELFDAVQEGTFKYFWDFAHPDSGTIREGYTHWWDLSATGGTGMGLMALVVVRIGFFK